MLPVEWSRTVGQQGPNPGDAPDVEGFGRSEPRHQRLELRSGTPHGLAVDGRVRVLGRRRLGGGTYPSQASGEEAALRAVVEMLRMDGYCDARLGGGAGGKCTIEGGGAESGREAVPGAHVPEPQTVAPLEEDDHGISS